MKLQQLEYFCSVAEEGSFSGASRVLHVAQPPISRQIALLEEELRTQLFIRGNKGVKLTQTGQRLYQESHILMQNINEIASKIRGIDQGVLGELKIGTVFSVTPYALESVKYYLSKYPKVELKIDIDTPQNLLEKLRKGTLQVIFIRGGASGQYGFHDKVLGEDPLELILTKELDPVPEMDEVPIEALKNVPFCLLRGDDIWGYGNYLIDECLKNGFQPNVVCQCYSTHIAVQMVVRKFGIGFMPRSIIETVPGSGVYSKSIHGLNAASSSLMLWNEYTMRSSCGKLFVEMVEMNDALLRGDNTQ